MNETTIQSVLYPARGSAAALIHELGMVLYVGTAVIFLLVIGLMLYATFSGPRRIDPRRWIVGGGLLFPIITLSVLLIYSLAIGDALETQPAADPLRIHVTGKRWWWEVRYEPGDDSDAIVLANELRVPAGRPVHIELTTSDVIHSFWVPTLAGKVDMIPGRTNHLVIQAAEPGVYRGQCAEYCGGQHALMAFYVVAEPEPAFERWLAREARPASVPTDPFLRLGYDMFFRGGCQECHAIRGTPAESSVGPDLTHVGSRRSLGAGVVGNHIGTMAAWIAGAQDLKPGNLMPSMNVYTGRELRAISAWLESLE
jgi:cytochrome c oxidase subunit 2